MVYITEPSFDPGIDKINSFEVPGCIQPYYITLDSSYNLYRCVLNAAVHKFDVLGLDMRFAFWRTKIDLFGCSGHRDIDVLI